MKKERDITEGMRKKNTRRNMRVWRVHLKKMRGRKGGQRETGMRKAMMIGGGIEAETGEVDTGRSKGQYVMDDDTGSK